MPVPSVRAPHQRGMHHSGSCRRSGGPTRRKMNSLPELLLQPEWMRIRSGIHCNQARRAQSNFLPSKCLKKQPDRIFSWTARHLNRPINQKHPPIEMTPCLPSDTYHFNNIIYSSIVAIRSPTENWLLQRVAITF